jgi:hypothetical protein
MHHVVQSQRPNCSVRAVLLEAVLVVSVSQTIYAGGTTTQIQEVRRVVFEQAHAHTDSKQLAASLRRHAPTRLTKVASVIHTAQIARPLV